MPTYTQSIRLPKGTNWTATIIAEEGYNAGNLNKSSGIMIADDTIYASEATLIEPIQPGYNIDIQVEEYIDSQKVDFESEGITTNYLETGNWSFKLNDDGTGTIYCDPNQDNYFIYQIYNISHYQIKTEISAFILYDTFISEKTTSYSNLDLNSFDSDSLTISAQNSQEPIIISKGTMDYIMGQYEEDIDKTINISIIYRITLITKEEPEPEPDDPRGYESKNFRLEHLDSTNQGSYIGYWTADPNGYLSDLYDDWSIDPIITGTGGNLYPAFNNNTNPMASFGIKCQNNGKDIIHVVFNPFFSDICKRYNYNYCAITMVEHGTAVGQQVSAYFPLLDADFDYPPNIVDKDNIGNKVVHSEVNHSSNTLMNFILNIAPSYSSRVTINLLVFTLFYHKD